MESLGSLILQSIHLLQDTNITVKQQQKLLENQINTMIADYDSGHEDDDDDIKLRKRSEKTEKLQRLVDTERQMRRDIETLYDKVMKDLEAIELEEKVTKSTKNDGSLYNLLLNDLDSKKPEVNVTGSSVNGKSMK